MSPKTPIPLLALLAAANLPFISHARADEPADSTPTYAGEVAAIIQAKCQRCHRPGQVAPFPLLTHAQAKRWAPMIAEVVDEGRMPPWHANPEHGRFANDRSLSPDERRILLAWVEAGAPAGNLELAPPNPEFPKDWSIGEPDVILEMPREYTVKANGVLPYQRFRVPTNFTEDKWIQAAEVRPGARAVVHHVLVFVDDKTGEVGAEDPLNQLAGYVPGDVPTVFPPGVAKKIPAGSDLVFQVHYTPVGKEMTDRTVLGLVFAKEPPRARAATAGIFETRFLIPPRAPNHRVERWFTVDSESTILSLWPHMHVRGKDFRFTAHYPDGSTEILLDVPRYDFNWQSTYVLENPKTLPAGTRLHLVAHFDNSPDNPANPDPDRAVRWGEQTYDEMMIGYLDYIVERLDGSPTAPGEPAAKPLRQPRPGIAARLRQALRDREQNQPPADNPR